MKATPATLALLLPTRAVVLFFSGSYWRVTRDPSFSSALKARVARYCWPA
ncbi:hypothetical protein WMF21_40720 [Sorangium sp. So ce1099]